MFFRRLCLFNAVAACALGAALNDVPRRGCATEISPDEMRTVEAKFAEYKTLKALDDNRADPSPISIAWHVIFTNQTVEGGYLNETTINASVSALNDHYSGIGVNFTLDHVDYSQNTTWFIETDPIYKTVELEMKSALRVGDVATLNIYTVGFGTSHNNELLGFATFPWWYANSTIDDGVVILHSTVPGGSKLHYDEGKTLTHEVGHWLGLYHPFQGGCYGDGDFVSDTAPQVKPSYGCPVSQDSCIGGGPDNIHNFMDYSYDSCLDSFTPGQATRLREQMLYYRNATV